MRSLPRPSLLVAQVFASCVDGLDDDSPHGELKKQKAAASKALTEWEADYMAASTIGENYKIEQTSVRSALLSKDEMSWLYESRFAKAKTPGRALYDEIRAVALNVPCPLCARRDADTLDHYLPKASFPGFAITPANLVPACMQCNKAKGVHHASNASQQTLHPYFDRIDDEIWLRAEVVRGEIAALSFSVSPPESWSSTLRDRVIYHFGCFGLARLYASNAASELANIRWSMSSLFNVGGAGAVRERLLEMKLSHETNNPNSWSSASYRALSVSDWFCEVGFEFSRA